MRLIKESDIIGIDKGEIDALLAAKNFVGLNYSPRFEKIIVSLTSYKPRINDVKYTIYSLLNQSLPPDKLILWLDEDSFPQREENLPQDLLELRDFGLTIDWCENLRSYKKLIPALEKFPDDIIVTADDDIFYQPDWLEILYDAHLENPDCVVAHRTHRIKIDTQGNLFPYTSWDHETKFSAPPPKLFGTFFTGGAGALYKKNFLHADVLNRELFLKLTPLADDIWFWAMAILNDTKVALPPAAQPDLIYVDLDTQLIGETLWHGNKIYNDIYLRQVTEHYPALLEKLIREAAEFKPYISVVLPMKNISDADTRLKNIFVQSFPDFELIFINLGSRLEFQRLPTNFRVVNYPGGSLEDALTLGLQRAAGDYVLFADENSTLFNDAIENLAQLSNDSKADVIHFSGHEKDARFIADDAISFETLAPVFFDEPRQSRAVFWLKGKLSRRLDTKIFRRKFLIEHDINFAGGTSEFLFHALIQAEKYLLVPQAFCKE